MISDSKRKQIHFTCFIIGVAFTPLTWVILLVAFETGHGGCYGTAPPGSEPLLLSQFWFAVVSSWLCLMLGHSLFRIDSMIVKAMDKSLFVRGNQYKSYANNMISLISVLLTLSIGLIFVYVVYKYEVCASI